MEELTGSLDSLRKNVSPPLKSISLKLGTVGEKIEASADEVKASVDALTAAIKEASEKADKISTRLVIWTAVLAGLTGILALVAAKQLLGG